MLEAKQGEKGALLRGSQLGIRVQMLWGGCLHRRGSSKRNQGEVEKWLIPGLEQGNNKINLELLLCVRK